MNAHTECAYTQYDYNHYYHASYIAELHGHDMVRQEAKFMHNNMHVFYTFPLYIYRPSIYDTLIFRYWIMMCQTNVAMQFC